MAVLSRAPVLPVLRLPRLLIALSGVWILTFCAVAGAVSVDPSDPNLRYTGRWEQSNPSAPWAQAKGSSIIASFEGTSFALTVTTSGSEYYRIIVDGDAAGGAKQTLPSGASATLVSGLADTVHQIEIVKETDLDRMTIIAVELDAGRSLVAPPAPPSRRMVFYGDSNLAGYSLESERNLGGSFRQGSYYTYAGITARMFGAEYHNISKSGATINSLNGRFDRVDWGSNNPGWDFGSFLADVVVVNIGANDLGAPKSTIKNRYHNLLDDLRVAHPSSHIVLYNAYGWDFNEPANYTNEVVAERSDPNLSVAVFPWLFEQFHGCETDHAGMATVLASHLTTVLGWVSAPADVMSGYGQSGSVANSSFEQVAPFGGWGWRYFDDSGVSRINDALGAFHGEHFLRLSDGAASHQTNPAEDGDVRSLLVWMRSPNPGDEVEITLDFRDQASGGEANAPMQSDTETRVLTVNWQPYSMIAVAPVSPPDPVFASRLTFRALVGDTVEIDRIIFVPEPAQWRVLLPGLVLLAALRSRIRS